MGSIKRGLTASSAASSSPLQNIYALGSVGENAFHTAALYRGNSPEGHEIIKYLVDTFGPRLVNCP